MKKIFKKTISISFIILLTVISCSKEEEKTTTPVIIDGFTWSENGGPTQTADSAYFTSIFFGAAYQIRAFKGSSFFNINVSNITPSTYSIDNIKGNTLSYTVNTALFTAKSGNIIISSGSSTKISGSFTCTGSGSSTSLTSLSGTFNNIVKR